jgi:hypothetical protein
MPVVPVPPANPPAPKPPAIVLFEEVEAEPNAVKEVVLRHLPPGTAMERALASLQDQGFSCREYSNWGWFFNRTELIPAGIRLTLDQIQRIYAQRKQQPMFCYATLKGRAEWHLDSYCVLLVLIPDAAGALLDVETGVGRRRHWNEGFFKQRPELHDPVGLPLEEARTQLVNAGFYCMGDAKDPEKDARPYVLLVAYDENLLGGKVVRVHLYSDNAGVVRETQVVEEPDFFDQEKCMLPHGDETPTWAVCKGALFPVRVVCRYTLITAAVCLACAASGPPVMVIRK